jgi:predicted ATPase
MAQTKQFGKPSGIQLQAVRVRKARPWPTEFPYSVPVIRTLEAIEFDTQVTFFVGENGCGKSTLMEALACAVGAIAVGSENLQTDRTLEPARELARSLQLSWSRKNHRGFFMRAEDFFGFARRISATRQELESDLRDVERDYSTRSRTAQIYARSAYAGQLGALRKDYGGDLDAQSHGESFLALFRTRFVPGGLYLLDEPEAPLSPLRQLTFLAMLDQMVKQDAQFIIATHSPIIMAFPKATIFSLDKVPIQRVRYDELEHVQIMRGFLANPQLYFRDLFAEGDAES